MKKIKFASSTSQTTFRIQTAAACMPGSCWGRYGKIAVIEVEAGYEQSIRMISDRARGVVRVVRIWDRLHKGTTQRCAYARAMVEAKAMVSEMSNNRNGTKGTT